MHQTDCRCTYHGCMMDMGDSHLGKGWMKWFVHVCTYRHLHQRCADDVMIRVWMCNVVYDVIDHANVCIYMGQSLSRPTHHPGQGFFRYYLVYSAIGAGALLLYGNSSLEACTLPSRFSRWAPIYLRWRWTFSLALLSTSKAATYCVLSRASRCIVHVQHL